MTRTLAAALILTLSTASVVFGQDGARKPEVSSQTKGNVTSTNVSGPWGWKAMVDAARGIRNLPADRDAEIISTLTAKKDELPAPYLYEVVRRVCATSPDEAAFLFMLAGMRMRYDAFRCLDETAQAGIQATLVEASPIVCPATTEPKRLVSALKRVKADPSLFATKYSPWWICSHGMAAVQAGLAGKTLTEGEWLLQREKWSEARAKVEDTIDFTLKKYAQP